MGKPPTIGEMASHIAIGFTLQQTINLNNLSDYILFNLYINAPPVNNFI